MREITAAEGLALSFDGGGQARLEWREADWLGPVGLRFKSGIETVGPGAHGAGADGWGPFARHDITAGEALPLAPGIRAYTEIPLIVFTLEAREELSFGEPSGLDRPRVAWPYAEVGARTGKDFIDRTGVFGYQLTEFAFPLFADGMFQGLRYYLDRPRAAMPLALHHDDGSCLVLCPLNAFHDQLAGLPDANDGALACGWHGDLARVPKGFVTEFAVLAGQGVRTTLERLGVLLRQRYGTRRPSRYADEGIAKLSYWTDNGAAYWYRSEDGEPVHDTLVRVRKDLDGKEIPVRAFQLDSWFYHHEHPRPLNPSGEDIVPPSGMMLWEAREDMLPKGVAGLSEALGNPPLILHSRHFSKASPYFSRTEAWLDDEYAHPKTADLYDRLMGQAKAWGAVTYEQDWMSEAYLFVRGLREEPGRAARWQAELARAAEGHGLTLQWCMATPMDFLHTLSFGNVTSIRTSNDYRYKAGNDVGWFWFLYVNVFARSLGLHPYKDVFFSSSSGSGIDGDPHAEVEALLSALSAGPVGIGDRIGRSDPAVISRTCRRDGVLLKPDVPVAAVDACFDKAHPALSEAALVADCHSDHDAGRWHYIVTLNVAMSRKPVAVRLPVADWIGGTEKVAVYNWRTGEIAVADRQAMLEAELGGMGWAYWVLAPVGSSGIAVIGDVSKYAAAADMRLRNMREMPDGMSMDVIGAPGESVTITAWAHANCEAASASTTLTMDQDADGRVTVSLTLPDTGRTEMVLINRPPSGQASRPSGPRRGVIS